MQSLNKVVTQVPTAHIPCLSDLSVDTCLPNFLVWLDVTITALLFLNVLTYLDCLGPGTTADLSIPAF